MLRIKKIALVLTLVASLLIGVVGSASACTGSGGTCPCPTPAPC